MIPEYGPVKRIYIPGVPDVKMRARATKNGRMYDPNAQAKEASLQKACVSGNAKIFDSPINIEFEFIFARPKNHYRTGKNAGILRPDAPVHCTNKKDLDNMEKFYADSFNCIAWVDDNLIVKSSALKRWATDKEMPHVLILAEEI